MVLSAAVVITSFLLQLVSAGLALRLVLITGRRTAGILILCTILLMAFRRFISLYRLMGGGTIKTDLTAEITALIVSFMMMIGITYITRLILREKEAVERVREREKFLDTIINSEPECVKLLRPDGTLLMMNKAGLSMLQADSFDAVKNTSVYPLVTPEYREAFKGLTDEVFQGKTGSLEFELTGIKGSRLWLDTHAVPLYGDRNEIVALLGITRNITEKKKLEEEKESLILELREALSNLKILRGFLPICAACKKIRNDQGYWDQIESYIQKHSEARFSHSICPACSKSLYPDYHNE